MALTAAQLTQLKTELTNDPNSYGYSPFRIARDDDALTIMLNHPRNGSTIPQRAGQNLGVAGAALSTVGRADVTREELLDAIDNRDLTTPSSAAIGSVQAAVLAAILSLPRIRLSDSAGAATRTRGNLDRAISPGGQGSQGRFNGLATRSESRAEDLFGYGVVLSLDDVSNALNLP